MTLPVLTRMAAATCLALALAAPPLLAADDFSAAERALFINNQLGTLQPPATLRYGYRRQGSLESAFDDQVSITLRKTAEGVCCSASAEFLHGERQLKLPDIEAAQGNPAILYFLERDIREMQRLTKGQPNYFRKRIRMAVFQGAEMRPVQVAWLGKPVDAQEVVISPYLDDPLRARFEQLAGKQYVFTLSDAVPGGLFSIRTRVAGAAGAAPLLVEEMQLQALEAAPPLAATGAKPRKTAQSVAATTRRQP